jgi:hypothetical protein
MFLCCRRFWHIPPHAGSTIGSYLFVCRPLHLELFVSLHTQYHTVSTKLQRSLKNSSSLYLPALSLSSPNIYTISRLWLFRAVLLLAQLSTTRLITHPSVGTQTDRLDALSTMASLVVARSAPATSCAAAKPLCLLAQVLSA